MEALFLESKGVAVFGLVLLLIILIGGGRVLLVGPDEAAVVVNYISGTRRQLSTGIHYIPFTMRVLDYRWTQRQTIRGNTQTAIDRGKQPHCVTGP